MICKIQLNVQLMKKKEGPGPESVKNKSDPEALKAWSPI